MLKMEPPIFRRKRFITKSGAKKMGCNQPTNNLLYNNRFLQKNKLLRQVVTPRALLRAQNLLIAARIEAQTANRVELIQRKGKAATHYARVGMTTDTRRGITLFSIQAWQKEERTRSIEPELLEAREQLGPVLQLGSLKTWGLSLDQHFTLCEKQSEIPIIPL